jgi:hypothetical protein
VLGTTYDEWYATGWTWQSIDLATLSKREKVTKKSGAYSGFAVSSQEGVFLSETADDYSRTTLVKIDQGERAEGLSFAGFTLGVERIR